MADHDALAAIARNAVAKASTVCRHVQQTLDEVRAITKDDRSPVTIADFASQAIVARELTAVLDDVVLVAEEDSAFLRDPDHTSHLHATVQAVQQVFPTATESDVLDWIDIGGGQPRSDGFWTLDPIDGTKGFLRGQQYAIALGFVVDGKPVVGALACPNMPAGFDTPLDQADAHGCLYTAVSGSGTVVTPCDDPDTTPVSVTRDDHPEGQPISVCASVEKAHTNVSDTDRILELIGEAGEPTRLDSQAKYAVTGRGQADAYLRLPTRKDYVERIWDHAAGSLVATECGCVVSDIFGRSLDFSHGRGLETNKGIVCAPPRVHALMIEAIEKLKIGLAVEV